MFDINKIIKQAEDNGLKSVTVRTNEIDGKIVSIDVNWSSITADTNNE